MKKTLLLAAALLTQMAAMAQTLFTSDFSSEDEFARWTVLDANADEKTWKFDAEADVSKVFYSYHSSNNADDWLFSPAITPTEDCTLLVQYSVASAGTYFEEAAECGYGPAAAPDQMTIGDVNSSVKGKTPQMRYFIMQAKAGEAFHIGLHAISKADTYRLYACGVIVSVCNNPVDLKVAEITSPQSGEGLTSGEAVTVRVENAGGVDVQSFSVSYAVNGGEAVTETVSQELKAGASMDYTFAVKADLSTPRQKYAIKAWTSHDDEINTTNDSCAVEVKHIAPATVPYFMGFEADEETDYIKFYNLNNDDNTWKIKANEFWTAYTDRGQRCLGYGYNYTNAADDWAILDGIKVEEPGYYAFKFWYAADERNAEKLSVWYGNGDTPDDMTTKVVEYAPFLSPLGYEQSISIIYLDKPQTIYFGFYAFSDRNKNWLTIDDVTFEKITEEDADLALTKIATPTEYVHKNSSKDLAFTVRNIGIKDLKGSIAVSIDGETMTTRNVSVEAQGTKDITFANVLNSLTAGEHTLKLVLTASGDTNAENDTIKRTFRVMPDADVYYDFEDGKIPEGFSTYVFDSGTINPSAGDDLIGTDGWAVMELGATHSQLGDYLLSGTSYLEGVSQADRFVVLPQVHVGEGDSYIVWDGRSFNDKYPEDYDVRVGTVADDEWSYSSLCPVYLENGTTVQTHGASLKKYAGQDVYIAFKLMTKIGDRVLLDNIGLYGISTATGINTVSAEAVKGIAYNGNAVTATGATSITVADISGRTVVSAAASKADVSQLQPGIYVATATTADRVKTIKFVKK